MASSEPVTVMQAFIFGDQTCGFIPSLRQLLACKNKPILDAFLQQAHSVIRAEMNVSLQAKERNAARTASLVDLLQKYTQGSLSPAFQMVLHCITQLGSFISHHEEPGTPFPNPSETYVLGLCTGSLAAVATVRVAFRAGVTTVRVRDEIAIQNEDGKGEWSAVFFKLDHIQASVAIKDFCASKNLPNTSRPWIGAFDGKNTTISAPPEILKQLREDSALSTLKSKAIPIFVPSHGRHIFSTADVDSILETTTESRFEAMSAFFPIVFGAKGESCYTGSLLSLLRRALTEGLMESIRWDLVCKNFSEIVRSREGNEVTIIPIATNVEQSLALALKDLIKVTIKKPKVSDCAPAHSTLPGKSKFAIVGMSGRFPESQTPEAFWDLLYQGLDVCKEVPIGRWDIKTHVDPTGKAKEKSQTPWGCWLDFCHEFDPRFFKISPREAMQMDPASRMALMCTYEAMEGAGLVPNTTPSTQNDRIGVFHGVTSNDYMETCSTQEIDAYSIVGGNRGFIPGRINFCFEFAGPSYTNDTACSSSLAAIHLACNSLWRGDCDTAVAGGTNMIFNPDGHAGLDKGFFLSSTGNCKAFDDAADGYCRAEGVATVIIKRLEDALAENDPILAVILDTKTNHSAMSESMTRPHLGAQVDNMTSVLNAANVDPTELSYIEMHGTGTQVGDAVEMESVLAVFAPNEDFRGPEKPLYVGSVKANVGHGEGVSGITSLAKILLMVKHNTIPPHCGIKPGSKINHKYPDLNARNVHIAFKPTAWTRDVEPRKFLINNFSAAGGNTALLMEDAPIRVPVTGSDARNSHIIAISGHAAVSVKKNLQRLLAYVTEEESNGLSLSQLSWTTTARRTHYLFRVSITGSNITEIKQSLQDAIARGAGSTRPKSKPDVLFAFTGQGAQFMGMGKQLFEEFPRFQADLRHFDQLAQNLGFPSFVEVFTTSHGDIEKYSPVVVQLSTISLQIALARLMISFGVSPGNVVGHSLGEYAALHIAGVLSISETLFLVGKRAELLVENCQRGTHSMLAIKASQEKVIALLGGNSYDIACVNGPEDTVIAADTLEIDSAKAILGANGVKSMLVKVPYAFHSAQVEPILQGFKAVANSTTFRKPNIGILSPLLGDLIREAGIVDSAYLLRHCRETVNMAEVLRNAHQSKYITDKTVTIEIGPHSTVSGMIKATLGQQMQTQPIVQRGKDVWTNLTSALSSLYTAGHDINWVEYHAPFAAAHTVLELPTYGWDLKEYSIPYRNDWLIHKGEHATGLLKQSEPIVPTSGTKKPVTVPKPTPVSTAATTPELLLPLLASVSKPETTSIHKLLEEDYTASGANLVFETDLSHPEANGISRGHIVDNIPFVVPAFFSDMATVIGKYLVQRLALRSSVIVDICNLTADKVLIPGPGSAPQLLRTAVKLEWAPGAAKAVQSALCNFYSKRGRKTAEHVKCLIRFSDKTRLQALQLQVPGIVKKIQRLRGGGDSGDFLKYNKTSGYKLMKEVATFHPDYKLLDEVILDEATLEACCTMSFGSVTPGGNYAAHPAYIDAITQLGGFAVNASDLVDLATHVFIGHGWDSIQIYEEMKTDRKYDTYVQMQRHGEDFFRGDTIVLDGTTIVASFSGVTVSKVSRRTHQLVMSAFVNKAAQKTGTSPKDTAGEKPTKATLKASLPAPVTAPKSQVPQVAPVPSVSLPEREKSIAQVTPKVPKTPTDAKQFNAALALVAEESGIALEELTDDTNFADIGVDSLLSMVIGSRFREDLNMELDAEFSLFVACPTVKLLRSFIQELSGQGEQEEIPDKVHEKEALPEVNTTEEIVPSPVQTIPLSQKILKNNVEEKSGPAKKVPVATDRRTTSAPPDSEVFLAAREIVAEESGIAVSELTDDCNFADIGVDSLLSMVIGSRFRDEMGLDLDPEFSIFVNCPTIGDLRSFLAATIAGQDTGASSSSDGEVVSSTPMTAATESDEWLDVKVDICKPATSVIMQGVPKTAAKTLFLLPDGSGSASSYVSVPRLKGDIAIIGINCPYVRTPNEMSCTPHVLLDSYCNEIRRRQPQGPYHFGGWSSGGAFAFGCAERMLSRGEEVHSLIIIDSPLPHEMEELPAAFYEHVGELGLYGQDTPPPYLIPHFMRTVETMAGYKAKPLQTRSMPKVGILWACEVVMAEEDAPGIKKTHFMTRRRSNFGPDGWDTVLPGANIVVERAVGANHFTMMQKGHVQNVSALIEKIMA
ncbi:polyketide synthase [Hyphodiscus hymeniophilus]|uniref:Polyketide synthase n=1 Tax=Hyphodiscus hymeniophilus TaxID=353542 RepID=A0A9P6SMA4_9HELO|nr:polyketide synthase [Hyphodiscus hymeniophilus]